MPCPARAGSRSSHVEAVQTRDELMRPGADGRQLLLRRHAAQIGRRTVLVDRLLQAGDADHEELVEVRRGDRRELDALEQRIRRVGRFLEHALVEGEP